MRCYVLIFIPVFSGPYWVSFRLATHSYTFALFFGVFVRLCHSSVPHRGCLFEHGDLL